MLVDDTVEKVIDFLDQQIKGCENGRPFRGPYLAQLHLVKLLLDRKHQSIKLVGRLCFHLTDTSLLNQSYLNY